MEKYLSFFIVYMSCCCFDSIFAGLEVSLPNGKIRGREQKTSNNQTYYAYQGIPYATPPLGNLRFQAPTAVKNWYGIMETTKDSNFCYSVKIDSPQEDEDCLYLNVFTPVLNAELTNTRLPVMFWIYGGAFRTGASIFNSTGPDYFVEQGIVVVTFNYRIGPFGFLATGDTVVSGNAGLKDQSFALKWTHENIVLFGGDPEQITLAGQSAGAASVGYHVLSKQSSGLFRAVIAQSGSPLCSWAFFDDPKSYAFSLAAEINSDISLNDTNQLIDYLQEVDAKEIDSASTKLRLTLPVIEPEHNEAFITEEMYGLLEKGDINKVPLLIGFNSEEHIAMIKDHRKLRTTAQRFDDDKSNLIPRNLKLSNNISTSLVGEEIRKIYLQNNETFYTNLGTVIRYMSDSSFSKSIIKHAQLQSRYTDVYFYQFSYDGIQGGFNKTIEGAQKVGHGEEGKYEFVYRDSPDNLDLSQWEEKDVTAHERLIALWTNFIKYTNPTPEKSELLQNIIWPKVDADNFEYLDIDENLKIKKDPKGCCFQGWSQVYEKYGVRPFATF